MFCAKAIAPGLLLICFWAIFCFSKSFSRLPFDWDSNSVNKITSSFSKISLVSGFSGGFLAIRLYKLTYFTLGFICGGSVGYLLHEIIFYKYKYLPYSLG